MMRDYRSSAPEDQDQRLVSTPYGRGLVIRTRNDTGTNDDGSTVATELIDPGTLLWGKKSSDGRNGGGVMQEVKLLDWETGGPSNGGVGGTVSSRRSRSPMLYSTSDLPSIAPLVGYDVLCPFGRGVVTDLVYDDDGASVVRYVVTLTSWRLAGRSRVTCHLAPESLAVVRKQVLGEMDAFGRVDHARQLKREAGVVFSGATTTATSEPAVRYERARALYAQAVDAVRYVRHDARSTNELRADLVEVMVTSSNNAATCCVQLQRWPEARRYAENALVLSDALYAKRGGKIHTILRHDNKLTDAKIFAEWRGKSTVIVAKALMLHDQNYAGAATKLKEARQLLAPYTTDAASRTALSSMEKDVARTLRLCVQKKKAIDKKERRRAQAMFGATTKGSASNTNTTKKSSKSTNGAKSSAHKPAVKHGSTSSTQRPAAPHHPPQSGEEDIKESLLPPPPPRSVLRRKSSSESSSSSQHDRNVHWTGVPEKDAGNDTTPPWYREHQEALLLAGVGGLLAAAAALLLRPRK